MSTQKGYAAAGLQPQRFHASAISARQGGLNRNNCVTLLRDAAKVRTTNSPLHETLFAGLVLTPD